MKNSFIIHTSFYEPVKSLSDKQLGRIFRALFDYQLGNEVQVEDDIKMAFLFFKNQIDIDEQKYKNKVETNKQNGAKGGAPKGNSNAHKKTTENNRNKQTVKKTTETSLNDNDNDNDNNILKPPNPLKKGGGSKRDEKEDSLNAKARKVFEEHYHNTFSENYYWTAKDAGNMAKLLSALKFRLEQKGLPDETEDVINALQSFLESIYDKWILANYSVPVIFSKFNEIITQAKEKKDDQKKDNIYMP